MLIPKVKICCIASIEEAQLAIGAGAAAIGLVGPMPSGPGVISNHQIREIVDQLPTSVETFLLTSETSAKNIIHHHQKVNTTTIQLVDTIDENGHERIKHALPDIRLVQVIHVLDEKSVNYALSLGPNIDALLLDSGNPNLAVKQLGGTGRIHNWEFSRMIVRHSPKPVWLAGGLHPGNVHQAIAQVQPYGLDLCSGIRTQGRLDPEKMAAFFRKVNTGATN